MNYITVVYVLDEGIVAQDHFDQLDQAKASAFKAKSRLQDARKDYHIFVVDRDAKKDSTGRPDSYLEIFTQRGRIGHPRVGR